MNAQLKAQEIYTLDPQASLEDKIKTLLSEPYILFMKGNDAVPQCGFSANSCRLLHLSNIPFKTYDILKDPEIRSGLKEYSQWPTYPQFYAKGELLGGNDILTEMYQQGQLAQLRS
jgi:monothiol glutaredoxin